MRLELRQSRETFCTRSLVRNAVWLIPSLLLEPAGLYLGNRWESQLFGVADRWDAASADEEAPSVNEIFVRETRFNTIFGRPCVHGSEDS